MSLVLLLVAVLVQPRVAAADDRVITPVTAPALVIHPLIQLDADVPVVLYIADDTLWLLRCGDTLCSAGNTVTELATLDFLQNFLSFTLDANGYPVIAYTDVELHILRCGNATCSAGNSDTTPVPAQTAWVSIEVDAAGFPVVAFSQFSIDGVQVLHCSDLNCSTGGTHSVVNTEPGSEAQELSMRLDSAGYPVVAYESIARGDLSLLRCGDADCSSGNTRVTVDSGPLFLGDSPSLALDASGIPVVAYAARVTNLIQDDEIRVARCGNVACNAGTTVATISDPEADDSRGHGSSLALDSSGIPTVAFGDPTKGFDTQVVRCGNASCSASNSLASPLGASLPSLALTSSGYPVVAARDGNLLKILICESAACDEPQCDGLDATIDLKATGGNGQGTAGPDVIRGTTGDDRIAGLGGDDTICGQGGDDIVRGGSGSDRIFGGPGDDELSGGGGPDYLAGGPGADIINGQGGPDTIDGGEDDDAIGGGGAHDVILGGAGVDRVDGNNGADLIDGGNGPDDIRGQTGPDVLRGGIGNDFLFGGSGSDTLYGGPGSTDRCKGNLGIDSAEAATCEVLSGVEILF